jgi:hypothetical protein
MNSMGFQVAETLLAQSAQDGLPPLRLHSARNFFRSLPCRFFASACSEQALEIAALGLSAATCLVVPLTTSTRRHPLRPSIGLVEEKNAHALLSQVRVIDTKRLVRKIGALDQSHFDDIRNAVRGML